jgi:intracellular multiplication protein IcmL
MTEEALCVVKLEDNYCRDSIGRVIFVIAGLGISIAFLLAVSVYLFMNKPQPITFRVAQEWRVVAPVPIQEPYLATADVLQWVSNVMPATFDLSYMHMDEQLEGMRKYFTENGYQVFLNQLSNFVNKDTMQTNKMFTHGEPTGAPTVVNQGVLAGRYAWWVQIPINISYAGLRQTLPVDLQMQVLVVREETTNNLTGILIDNVIVESGGTGKVTTRPSNT